MSLNPDIERFQREAEKYANYVETPEGRLRLDLPFANLREFFPDRTRSLRALDIGGGTGANAIRLAQLGVQVALLDPSMPMLEIAKRAAARADLDSQITYKHGDASNLTSLFEAASFDLVLCHNVLEFVEDPVAVLHAVARMMRDSAAIFSVLVRNQAGEALKAALVTGDLGVAENAMTALCADEGLYGGKVRLFTPDTLRAMLTSASLAVTAERGVRVLADYLPPTISRDDEYERIFQLERKLGMRPDFAAIARYTHILARRTAW